MTSAADLSLVGEISDEERLFDELIASDLYEAEIARRLTFFGLDPKAAHLVLLAEVDAGDGDGDRAARSAGEGAETPQDVRERLHWAVDEFLARRGVPFISAAREDAVAVLLQPDGTDAAALVGMARELREAIAAVVPEVSVSVGVGRPHERLTDLRQSYFEASYAIRIRRLKGECGVVASFDDLGSYGLLLGLQDTVSLEVFCDSVLGKLEQYDRENSSDLVRSLACFLEENGHWGDAAARLYVHRHTLRYRMKRIEEITGRDLDNSQDRMEFWLALKARELVAQSRRRQPAGA